MTVSLFPAKVPGPTNRGWGRSLLMILLALAAPLVRARVDDGRDNLPDSEGALTIREGVTEIATVAYAKAGIKSLSIPASVTTIGDGAFRENNLTSVTIGDSVTRIGKNAFSENDDLNSVCTTAPLSQVTVERDTFPSGVTLTSPCP